MVLEFNSMSAKKTLELDGRTYQIKAEVLSRDSFDECPKCTVSVRGIHGKELPLFELNITQDVASTSLTLLEAATEMLRDTLAAFTKKPF